MRLDPRQQLLGKFAALLLLRKQRQQRALRYILRRARKGFKNLTPRAAISVVQDSGEKSLTGTSTTATLTVSAGNLGVIVATQETDGTLFSVPSDGTNTWIKNEEQGDANRGVTMLASAQNLAGGSTTVTVGPSSGSKTFHFHFLEVSGCVTTGIDSGDKVSLDPVGTTHHCSASGINPSAACIIFTSSICNATAGTCTAGSGYTALTTASNFTFWQYQIFSIAPTSERGAWTSANSVNSNGAIGAFAQAAGGASPTEPELESSNRGLNRGLCRGVA